MSEKRAKLSIIEVIPLDEAKKMAADIVAEREAEYRDKVEQMQQERIARLNPFIAKYNEMLPRALANENVVMDVPVDPKLTDSDIQSVIEVNGHTVITRVISNDTLYVRITIQKL